MKAESEVIHAMGIPWWYEAQVRSMDHQAPC
jgi:hypothetical protein